jgi:hypothetical protein
LKTLLENYFKPSIYFLKNYFEKDQVSKYYFLSFIQTFASLLAKEMSYTVVYRAFYAKGLFEEYISKTILKKLFSDFEKGLFKTQILFALCK